MKTGGGPGGGGGGGGGGAQGALGTAGALNRDAGAIGPWWDGERGNPGCQLTRKTQSCQVLRDDSCSNKHRQQGERCTVNIFLKTFFPVKNVILRMHMQ